MIYVFLVMLSRFNDLTKHQIIDQKISFALIAFIEKNVIKASEFSDDKNRVKLPATDSVVDTDYINASYVEVRIYSEF